MRFYLWVTHWLTWWLSSFGWGHMHWSNPPIQLGRRSAQHAKFIQMPPTYRHTHTHPHLSSCLPVSVCTSDSVVPLTMIIQFILKIVCRIQLDVHNFRHVFMSIKQSYICVWHDVHARYCSIAAAHSFIDATNLHSIVVLCFVMGGCYGIYFIAANERLLIRAQEINWMSEGARGSMACKLNKPLFVRCTFFRFVHNHNNISANNNNKHVVFLRKLLLLLANFVSCACC